MPNFNSPNLQSIDSFKTISVSIGGMKLTKNNATS